MLNINALEFHGSWDDCLVLDKHITRSEHAGHTQEGYNIFNNTRSEVGEALYQLKYRQNYDQVDELAETMSYAIKKYLPKIDILVPLPASKPRKIQPVALLANKVADLLKIECIENLLIKDMATCQVKNLTSKEERTNALLGSMKVNQVLSSKVNIALFDDLFSTGSTMEAATQVLRRYNKIGSIFVVAFTKTK